MAATSADEGGEDEERPGGRSAQPPWSERPRDDPRQRVVGWRAGVALTAKDVQEILRREKTARHEYKGLRKAVAAGKTREQSDPLAGLPPTWQAFWSTVPHLDPQAAYRQFRKEQQRQAKAQEQLQPSHPAPDEEEEAAVKEETLKLDEEVRRKKQVLADKERLCGEWDKKLARVRILDRDEGELSRRVVRKLESASYAYGILEGKIRSSDIYFHFLYEDTKIAHGKKIGSLKRSSALMGKQIDSLKGEVRMLLRAAAEVQPSSDPLQSSEKKQSAESSEDKKASADPGASSSLPSHRHTPLEAAASSSPSFRPTLSEPTPVH
mmetsp:Transcript_8952/g.27828  ORF Transcript_8952/g.27828 Transcript_8952/m.27828 type:complete len:323 (-) Transcript_8952:565-1533(-)